MLCAVYLHRFLISFNTIQPHRLLEKLQNLNVNPSLILWISDFLKDDPASTSYFIRNTGAPQGCVLSPLLFMLYTNDYISYSNNVSIYKYADDTVIVGFLKDSDLDYRNSIKHFVTWCGDNFLKLNTQKTKEMIFLLQEIQTSVTLLQSMLISILSIPTSIWAHH